MNKVLYFVAISFLVICLAVVALDGFSQHVVNSLSDNLIRLHVVANSNSEFDQALKLSVRDNIIAYLEEYSNKYDIHEYNISGAEQFVTLNLQKINEIAQETVREMGYDYITNTRYGNFYFPVKKYEHFALPSGIYTALKVDIGEAAGKNWWCVLYPPLCFPEGSFGQISNERKQLFIDSISKSDSRVIMMSDSHKLNFRFKIVEFFQKLKLKPKTS